MNSILKIPLRPYNEKKFEVYYFRGERRTSSQCLIYFHCGDRLVWVARSSDLTHWATRAPNTIRRQYSEDKYFRSLPAIFIFSSQNSASSITKTGRHDIAELLLKVALKHQKSINQSIVMLLSVCPSFCQSFCNIFVNTLSNISFIRASSEVLGYWAGEYPRGLTVYQTQASTQ
jgi:hypothetical protein